MVIAPQSRDADGGEMTGQDLAKARPHHQENAQKPADHRGPAAPADRLLQDQPGKHRDEDGHQEDQRIGFRQRQRGEGNDTENAAERAARHPQKQQARPLGNEDIAPIVLRPLGEECRNQREQRNEEADLEDRQARTDSLQRRIADREAQIGGKGEKDAGLHEGRIRRESGKTATAYSIARRSGIDFAMRDELIWAFAESTATYDGVLHGRRSTCRRVICRTSLKAEPRTRKKAARGSCLFPSE